MLYVLVLRLRELGFRVQGSRPRLKFVGCELDMGLATFALTTDCGPRGADTSLRR